MAHQPYATRLDARQGVLKSGIPQRRKPIAQTSYAEALDRTFSNNPTSNILIAADVQQITHPDRPFTPDSICVVRVHHPSSSALERDRLRLTSTSNVNRPLKRISLEHDRFNLKRSCSKTLPARSRRRMIAEVLQGLRRSRRAMRRDRGADQPAQGRQQNCRNLQTSVSGLLEPVGADETAHARQQLAMKIRTCAAQPLLGQGHRRDLIAFDEERVADKLHREVR